MQSLLERIKAGTLWDFHGGIHPPENKDQSSLTPVVDAGLPPSSSSRYASTRALPATCWFGSATRSRKASRSPAMTRGVSCRCTPPPPAPSPPSVTTRWPTLRSRRSLHHPHPGWRRCLGRASGPQRLLESGAGRAARTHPAGRHRGPRRRRVPDPQQARWPRSADRDPDRQRAGVRTLHHHR